MKEIREFRKSYILLSAVYIVLGAVLLAWPDISVKMISYILGFSMLALGITYGIIYFTKDNLSGALQMDLVIGIVTAAFGIFILLNRTFLASVLPFAMGIILLLGSVVKLQNSITLRRLKLGRWYAALLAALLLASLGVVLLINPFKTERWMILYIGICLILDGLVNLVTMGIILSRARKLVNQQEEQAQERIADAGAQEAPAEKRRGAGLIRYRKDKR